MRTIETYDDFDMNEPESRKRQLKLGADLKEAAQKLSPDEARFLVSSYYRAQDDRIRHAGQVRALTEREQPSSILALLAALDDRTEMMVKGVLGYYGDSKRPGRWAKLQHGIGPVITAGLLAHIDIEQSKTAGHLWAFAGLAPDKVWHSRDNADAFVKQITDQLGAKITGEHYVQLGALTNRQPTKIEETALKFADGKKITAVHLAKAVARRPWNADLRTLCWKIGQSFMKFSGSPKCFYGHLYRDRKAYEVGRSDRGECAEQAKEILAAKRWTKGTPTREHLENGKLPPAQLDARARRWVVKLFLSHFLQVSFEAAGKVFPKPYSMGILGHTDYIDPPEWPCL